MKTIYKMVISVLTLFLMAGLVIAGSTITPDNIYGFTWISGDGDNEGIAVDNDGNVGIGTDNPSAKLDIAESGDISEFIISTWSSTGGDQSRLSLIKSASNTIGTYIETSDGDDLGEIAVYGSDSDNTITATAGQIKFIQNGDASSSRVPTDIAFLTGTITGLNEVMRISTDQKVGIGTESPSTKLEVQDGTVTIDQDTNALSLQLDSSATTETAFEMYGRGVYTGSDGFARINLEQAGSTGNALLVKNDGTGNGLFIDQNGATGDAIYIDTESQEYGIYLNYQNEYTGSATIYSLLDGATSTGRNMFLRNDGTGNSLFIDQNGDGIGLEIDSEATGVSDFAINIKTGQGASGIKVESSSDFKTDLVRGISGESVASNWFYRNFNSTTTSQPVVFIEQDNVGDDQDALSIQQDGTGALVSYTENGNTCDIHVDADGTCDSGTALAVDNSIALCMVCS